LGVAAVDVTAGGGKGRAEIFVAGPAVRTPAAGGVIPSDPDPVADLEKGGSGAGSLDPADNLMTKDDREGGRRGSAFYLVQFRMTDPAGGNPHQKFMIPRLGHRQLDRFQPAFPHLQGAGLFQKHCSHADLDSFHVY